MTRSMSVGHTGEGWIMSRITRRMRDESGLTMIELLIVLIIGMILITIAMPSYLGFRVRANNEAAKTNLHDVVPGLVQWNGDHTDGYASFTLTKMKLSYNIKVKNVSVFWPTTTTYCMKSKVGTVVWYKGGPSGSFTSAKPASICP